MLSRIRVAHYVVRGPIAIFLLPLVYALYILLNGCVFAWYILRRVIESFIQSDILHVFSCECVLFLFAKILFTTDYPMNNNNNNKV
jgi:hypothetical protein